MLYVQSSSITVFLYMIGRRYFLMIDINTYFTSCKRFMRKKISTDSLQTYWPWICERIRTKQCLHLLCWHAPVLGSRTVPQQTIHLHCWLLESRSCYTWNYYRNSPLSSKYDSSWMASQQKMLCNSMALDFARLLQLFWI